MSSQLVKAPTSISSSAPGRICLFGEHQDYLGLPVIAAAINLRVEVQGRRRADSLFSISMPDVGQELFFDPNQDLAYRHDRDYLPAAANVIRRQGLEWQAGYDVTVTGSIPINSGTSSSSALQVAWCSFLLAAAGDERASDAIEVARLAHASEVTEFGSPGGMMDHYSSAVGGVIWLDCETGRLERLPSWLGDFVLVDSGIPKDTNGVLGRVRRRVEQLNVSLPRLPLKWPEELSSEVARVPEDSRPLFRANLVNRMLAAQAKGVIESTKDGVALGQLLNQHHEELSSGVGVSLPAIDEMLDRGRRLGALGGKINGSGGGGAFFLYAPTNAPAVCEGFRSQGLRAWIVTPGPGLNVAIHAR